MAGFGAFLGGLSGGTIGASIVSLVLETKQFDAGLVKAKGRLTSATATMEGSTKRFGGLAQTAMLAAIPAALALGKAAVNAASDEEEALNKVNVVFGDSAEEVVRFAGISADSFGIAKAAALGAAGSFGNLLTGAGVATDAAAGMSVQMVQLAADIASFNNIDPTEALDKLRAGLVGEAEPLRTVGVLLSETRVQEEAYATGIATVGEKLTDAQKIQARYNIILKDTKVQQGDFARTSDSAANAQRRLVANVTDLAATFGRSLLPILKQILDVLNTLAPLLALVGDNAELLLIALGGFAAVRWVVPFIAALTVRLVALAGASLTAQVAVSSIFAGLARLAPPAAAAIAGVTLANKHLQGEMARVVIQAKDNVRWFAEAEQHAGAYGTTADELVATLGDLAHETPVVASATRQLGYEIQNGRISMVGFVEALEAFAASDDPDERAAAFSEILKTLNTQAVRGHLDVGIYRDTLERLGLTSDEVSAQMSNLTQRVTRSGRVMRNFVGLTNEELTGLREKVNTSFAQMATDVEGFNRKWTFTARHFRNRVDAMREKAEDLADDMAQLARVKAVPDAFMNWLLQQGPDAIHAFLQNNKAGRDEIIADWKAIGGSTDDYHRALRRVTDGVDRVKQHINDLPTRKTINLELVVHSSGAGGTVGDRAIADALARELVRGQSK